MNNFKITLIISKIVFSILTIMILIALLTKDYYGMIFPLLWLLFNFTSIFIVELIFLLKEKNK